MSARYMAGLPILIALTSGIAAGPSIDVNPKEMLAGSFQQVTFTFTAGASGIVLGGGVRIELPVAYLETGPCYWDRPQTELPEGRGYVRASCAGPADVEISLRGRWGGIVECIIARGPLGPGQRLTIEYSGVVQSLTWPLPARAQWRNSATERWRDVEDAPAITFRHQKPTTMVVVAPADVVHGEPFRLAVVLLDKFGNRASGYRGVASFSSTDPNADLPGAYRFTEKDAGVHVFESVRYNTVGFQKIAVTAADLRGRSNYSEVHESPPVLRRCFGETHFHTGTGTNNKAFADTSAGGDHRGHFTTQEAAYAYVRDVMRLDFASAAEHDTRDFDERAWERTQAIADAFYEPGEFTTFYGYEWTATPVEGHHVILYKEGGCKVLDHFQYPAKTTVYAALDQQEKPALMIPHAMWPQPDHGIWDDVNNTYRVVGEVYSLWNSRFLLQPGDDPQRFELGLDDRWSYQYAWHRGHKIGVIGSTDNHTGHPGANSYTADTQHAGGLACVWAAGNTRESIWEALESRRTYATTGTRILLEFKADGHWMGEEYSTTEAPTFVVKVAGTNTIDAVELVKHDGSGYRTLRAERPGTDVCVFEHTDEAFAGEGMYYVRVAQVDEHYRSPWAHTTAEWAWSSPIWITDAREAAP